MGEMLSAAFNIVGFNWISSPAATELEVIVLDWVAKMLKLPSQFLSSGKAAITFFSLMHKLFVDHKIYFCNFVLYM
jgi:glutamate/tyrosine decarboxylase-like PLP-dependent enzyme